MKGCDNGALGLRRLPSRRSEDTRSGAGPRGRGERGRLTFLQHEERRLNLTGIGGPYRRRTYGQSFRGPGANRKQA